jgi:hypothetical protein
MASPNNERVIGIKLTDDAMLGGPSCPRHRPRFSLTDDGRFT